MLSIFIIHYLMIHCVSCMQQYPKATLQAWWVVAASERSERNGSVSILPCGNRDFYVQQALHVWWLPAEQLYTYTHMKFNISEDIKFTLPMMNQEINKALISQCHWILQTTLKVLLVKCRSFKFSEFGNIVSRGESSPRYWVVKMETLTAALPSFADQVEPNHPCNQGRESPIPVTVIT